MDREARERRCKMIGLFQNSTLNLLGLWVAVSCLSGLLIFLIIKIFDWVFPNQSSSDRYQKSLAGLIFFFILNIAGTYYFSENESLDAGKTISLEFEKAENVNQVKQESILTDEKFPIDNKGKSNLINLFKIDLLLKSLGIFWLVGALVFSIKMMGGYFYMQSLIRNSQKSIPIQWSHFILNQLRNLEINKQVKVFESYKITSAFTFGFLRPVVALPLGFFTTLPAEQIEAVLLHELYHIKHKDYLINLLTMTFEVIFFYHPLMWWLAKSIRAERENRCDDRVTQILDKQVYAHALLNMEHYRQSLSYAIPFLNKQSNLKMRIMRIFEQKPERNIGLKPFLSLLMIVVFLMSFTFYKLEEPKKQLKSEAKSKSVEEVESQKSIDSDDEVIFKSENTRLELILEMTKNTLIAKTENKEVKLYIDNKLFPLNEKLPHGRDGMAKMFHLEEESAYYFFSNQYFESHDKEKWEDEFEYLATYNFDNPENSTFSIRIPEISETKQVRNEKNDEMGITSDEIEISNAFAKIESKPINLSSYKIHGPLRILTQNKIENLGDTNNLEVLKKLVSKFSKKEDTQVRIKIDSEFIEVGADIEKSLGNREIKNIRIVFPSEDAESGIIEIITDAMEAEGLKEISDVEKKSTEINEVSAGNDSISVSIFYETQNGNFNGEMKMNVERENVLDVFGIKTSDILFVVDGIEKKLGYKPGNDINPNEIKSITVLKDKKATDKYGEKAKNGVVEIYLKKE